MNKKLIYLCEWPLLIYKSFHCGVILINLVHIKNSIHISVQYLALIKKKLQNLIPSSTSKYSIYLPMQLWFEYNYYKWQLISSTSKVWVGVMVFNVTFNNISAISWRSVLLMAETGVPRENHWHAASHWQTLSHNVISNTHSHERDSNWQH